MSDVFKRLSRARLYLVCPGMEPTRLRAALTGGVDLVQLRMKDASDDEILAAAEDMRAACREHDALFLVNDRPDLAVQADADGVHVGQDDLPPEVVRGIVGPDRIIGLSTHAPDQLGDAHGVDYVAVGPVHETPTKPGRPAAGLGYVRYAANSYRRTPWFAIGGIDTETLPDVVGAGATRVVVVRALVDAEDPEATARALRAGLPEEVVGGRA